MPSDPKAFDVEREARRVCSAVFTDGTDGDSESTLIGRHPMSCPCCAALADTLRAAFAAGAESERGKAVTVEAVERATRVLSIHWDTYSPEMKAAGLSNMRRAILAALGEKP